jgi:hypothetical protein
MDKEMEGTSKVVAPISRGMVGIRKEGTAIGKAIAVMARRTADIREGKSGLMRISTMFRFQKALCHVSQLKMATEQQCPT